MDPIGERVMWFVLGVAFGAIASWLAYGSRRDRKPEPEAPAEPLDSAPAPAATTLSIEGASHPEPLASSRVIDVSAARGAGFNLRHADDLTIVDGIGPKIEEHLCANGADSFIKIACLSIDDLLDILDRGGPSFRFANPESWPQQASLAAQNRWKELRHMQAGRMDGDDPAASS